MPIIQGKNADSPTDEFSGWGLVPCVENNRELFRCPNDNNARPAGLDACTYNFSCSYYGGA